jgi:hypothetical protein
VPIFPDDSDEVERRLAAEEQERRAASLEQRLALIALQLFTAERAAIAAALARVQADAAVRAVLDAIRDAYRNPAGLFRRAWAQRLGEMAREQYAAEARRVRQATAEVTGRPVPAPTPRQVAQLAVAAETRAAVVARDICEGSAKVVDAVIETVTPAPPKTAADEQVQAAELRASPGGPGGGAPPPGRVAGAPSPRARVLQQRIDTLTPILGREAAEQIVTSVAETLDAGKPTRAVARELMTAVTAEPVSRKRSVRIARTEAIGLANASEADAVRTAGILRREALVRSKRLACA